jgi:hypothetical protein
MEAGDCSLWHHLIFCEELEINGEENYVDCWVCKIPLQGGPAYKCLECNFRQHKSCTKDVQIAHDLNQRHHLILIEEVDKDNGGKEEVVCWGCEEAILFGRPAYKCSVPECTFLLHKSCIDISHVIQQHIMHPEHPLFLQLPSWTNYCDVCREDCDNSSFYRCFTCDFDIDIKCAPRLRISAEDCHQHELLPTRKQIQFTCDACAEESKGIAYLCSLCGVITHPKCAYFSRTIKIRTHDHSLIRTYSLHQIKQPKNIFCQICFKKVDTECAAYYCQACGYIAHLNCANNFKDYDADQSATAEVDATQLVYLVEGINIAKDEGVGLQEFKHFSHPQHNLILSNEKLIDDMRCKACMQFIIFTPFYGCAQCNFFLHIKCTKLLTTIKRGKLHEHELTLVSQDPDIGSIGRFFCGVCRRSRHGFYYECNKCRYYKYDIQCCLIPNTLTHKGHQHSLYLAKRSFSETCDACGGTNDLKFVCTTCSKFAICFRCATLPLVARYKYDAHLLQLSYTHEDDFGEYYCLICEKERDNRDHWFYYCEECKFTAHTRCVIGESINYGRNFIDEDHEHPLTIVRKTILSPPCDYCSVPFVDEADWSFVHMAIECTQCKFIIHGKCFYDHLGELRNVRNSPSVSSVN